MTRDDPVAFGPAVLRMSAGAIIWAVHFTAIYGYSALACARGFNDEGTGLISAVPWVIGLATVIAAALTLALIVPVVRARKTASFTDWMRAGLAAFALNAIVLEGIAVLWVPVCA